MLEDLHHSLTFTLSWTLSPEGGLCTVHVALWDAALEVTRVLLAPGLAPSCCSSSLALVRAGLVEAGVVLHVVLPALLQSDAPGEGILALSGTSSTALSVSFVSLALNVLLFNIRSDN